MTTQLIESVRCANMLLKRLTVSQIGIKSVKYRQLLSEKSYSTKVESDKDNVDEPITYSSSQAAEWLARHSRKPHKDAPWFQPIVISLSLAVFLLYFCVLREENDIDIMLSQDLSDHFFKDSVPNDDTKK